MRPVAFSKPPTSPTVPIDAFASISAGYYEQLATLQRRPDLHRRAVELLEPALAQPADGPGDAEALEALVYAYAKLDRPRDELAAWKRYIPGLLDDRERIAPHHEHGRSADAPRARSTTPSPRSSRTIDLCESLPNSSGVNSTYALALWDLALALDRSGDPRDGDRDGAQGAALDVGGARRVRPGAGAADGLGLGRHPRRAQRLLRSGVGARVVPRARRGRRGAAGRRRAHAAAGWASAERRWDEYVSRATAAGGHDAWLPIARLRRARAQAAHAEAATRAAKEPTKPGPRAEPWSDD